jgi:hypothetical protein
MEGAIYLVSADGVFLGAFKENFGDQHFCNQISQIFHAPKNNIVDQE